MLTASKDVPALQLHIEPDEPIEVHELTNSLNSFAHQYQAFAVLQRLDTPSNARLLVSSVSPGSIDINFLPDIAAFCTTVSPLLDGLDLVSKFAQHINSLLDIFSGDSDAEVPQTISVKDCDDAVNIASPIAQHGGTQTFNIFNGPVVHFANLDQKTARNIVANATNHKANLQFPLSERRQRVSMVWTRLDREPATVKGTKSPDKGLIEEIDPKPKAILFTDELSCLKTEMLAEDENPMKKVYFVDVEISRIRDKIAAYRIVGFHGSDDLNSD